ncbi:MAG: hypothetical protein AAFP23_06855 [Pseudomonadota bacterium]
MSRTPEPERAARRWHDAAMGLPMAGIVLLLSPFAQVFAVEGRVFGIPVQVAYVFGAWGLLILIARFVARGMLSELDEPPQARARIAPRPVADADSALGATPPAPR